MGGKGRGVKFVWKDPVQWIVLEVEEVGGPLFCLCHIIMVTCWQCESSLKAG